LGFDLFPKQFKSSILGKNRSKKSNRAIDCVCNENSAISICDSMLPADGPICILNVQLPVADAKRSMRLFVLSHRDNTAATTSKKQLPMLSLLQAHCDIARLLEHNKRLCDDSVTKNAGTPICSCNFKYAYSAMKATKNHPQNLLVTL
jgi:hypothetical protein